MKRHYQSVDFVLSALISVHSGNLEKALEELIAAKDEPDFEDALEDMNNCQQELYDTDNSRDDNDSDKSNEEDTGVINYRSFKVG